MASPNMGSELSAEKTDRRARRRGVRDRHKQWPRTPLAMGNRLSRHASRQEAFELPRPHRVLQLADRLGLHLPHALAGDLEDAADLFQRVGVAVADPVA